MALLWSVSSAARLGSASLRLHFWRAWTARNLSIFIIGQFSLSSIIDVPRTHFGDWRTSSWHRERAIGSRPDRICFWGKCLFRALLDSNQFVSARTEFRFRHRPAAARSENRNLVSSFHSAHCIKSVTAHRHSGTQIHTHTHTHTLSRVNADTRSCGSRRNYNQIESASFHHVDFYETVADPSAASEVNIIDDLERFHREKLHTGEKIVGGKPMKRRTGEKKQM